MFLFIFYFNLLIVLHRYERGAKKILYWLKNKFLRSQRANSDFGLEEVFKDMKNVSV